MLPKSYFFTLLFLFGASVQAVEFTGRASVLGIVARAERGDVGYRPDASHTLKANQQGLRLMWDDFSEQAQWSVHVKTARVHLDGFPASGQHYSELFRYRDYTGNWHDNTRANKSTRIGYELDRALYKHRFDNMALSLGRQPIDWGSGRIWQPLNVFGAFAPTDLDTDYKSGIDGAILEWYPSSLASVSAAYILASQDNETVHNSGVVHLRHQVGEQSELALLAGSITRNDVIGGSFESAWGGMGWRIEGAYYRLEDGQNRGLFAIAGVDYQFEEGTLLALEWYHNNFGVSSSTSLPTIATNFFVQYQLQPQLGKNILGAVVSRDMTPLLRVNYLLLAGFLKDDANKDKTSLLHQLNFIYSLSDESDLLVSLNVASGEGLNQQGSLQSEFGHVPTGLTVRVRMYF